jgi:hypothetical protein
LADTGDKAVDVTLQNRYIQFEFAWEMLVQDRLAHACAFGDLVHTRRVVAVGYEHLAGSGEELEPACISRKAGAATGSSRLTGRCTAIGFCPIREFCHVAVQSEQK